MTIIRNAQKILGLVLMIVFDLMAIPYIGMADDMAQAPEVKANAVTSPSGFIVNQAVHESKNKISFWGYIGTPRNPKPAAMSVDANGHLLWELALEDELGAYMDAVRLNETQMLAIRQEKGNFSSCILDIIDSGKIQKQVQLDNLANRVFAVENGVILVAIDEFNNQQLVLMDRDCSVEWIECFEENVTIVDIDQVAGDYVAVGYTQENGGAENYGYSIVFDASGRILQTYNSSQVESFKAVLPSDNGWFIVGDTYDYESTALYNSVLYFENGNQSFRVNNDTDTLPQRDRIVLNAAVLDGECILAIKERKKGDVVILQSYTTEGEIVYTKKISIDPIINVQSAYVFEMNNGMLLIATGYTKKDNYQEQAIVIRDIK